MSYLIIILVIALALAPLSHFVPSKAQRKVARLREYAAIQGLFVEFREIPGNAVSPVRGNHGRTIYYGKRVRARGRDSVKPIAWLPREEGWTSEPRRQPVPPQLSAFPAGILAVGADPDSCGVYWQESGDEQEIDQICGALAALAEGLYQ